MVVRCGLFVAVPLSLLYIFLEVTTPLIVSLLQSPLVHAVGGVDVRAEVGGRGQGRGRGVVRGGRSSVLVKLRNLPRNVAADQCYGLLSADVDPFYTELAHLRQGPVALREQLDALGDDEASAAQRAKLEPLVMRFLHSLQP